MAFIQSIKFYENQIALDKKQYSEKNTYTKLFSLTGWGYKEILNGRG